MGGLTCKVRHFIALVLSVAVTSCILTFVGQKPPAHTFKDIVTQTHRQLESLKENFQGDGSWDKRLDVEEKYAHLLGLNGHHAESSSGETTQTEKLGLDPSDFVIPNGTLPFIVVTSISKSQVLQVEDFLSNVQLTMPNNPVILWNVEPSTPIGEYDDFSLTLKQLCNTSTCLIKRFRFEDYPEHVKDLSFRAYRPLIIQMMAELDGGCILWLDIDRRFLSSTKSNLKGFIESAINGDGRGIVAWPSGHPTSSLTHPKMLQFFQTKAENYFFHRMIDPSQLVVCKSENMVDKVMKPWIACSLKKDCIAPFGAQSGGCRFDKKPLYRYSGCHAYDASALNVALGLAFPPHQPYISRTPLSRPVQLLMTNTTVSV